jgi:uncharacterized protein YndB with AHSA1/START domain
MPIKNDTKRRWVELEFLVPGAPEQVWRAIATGPGLTAWFTPTTVDERVGGNVQFDLGENASSSGTVTRWEPPFCFAYEEHGWSEKAPPLATECFVEARSGGRCVVRLVHSLFTTSDTWDAELEGFESGWPGFFEVLRVYLRDFADQPAAVAHAMAMYEGAHAEAWQRLAAPLGLLGPNLGERRSTAAGSPTLLGHVERVNQGQKSCEVLLRIAEPAPGLALIGTFPWQDKSRVAASFFFYGERAPDVAAKVEPEWRRWLQSEFPSTASASSSQ